MKQGQLSLMIIVGLVVVIMTGVGYYIVNSESETRQTDAVKGVQLSREIVQPIREYVTGCLKAAANDAVKQIGMQGGVLYSENQGGLTPRGDLISGVNSLNYDDFDVWYGLYAPEGEGLYSSYVPTYPWKSFPFCKESMEPIPAAPGCSSGRTYKGYYGINRLPVLNGTTLQPAQPSMESQLVAAVQKNVDSCLDWSKFVQVDITPPHSVVQVMLNDEDTTFILNASLVVKMKDGSGETALPTFTAKMPVRLKKVHNVTKQVIDADATDITYDPLTYFGDAIHVSIVRNASDNIAGDDLLVFTDAASKIDGNPYEFRVMRHNRPPALSYIPNPTTLQIQLCALQSGYAANVTREGDHLVFNVDDCDGTVPHPKGGVWPPTNYAANSSLGEIVSFDPDEDEVFMTMRAGGTDLVAGGDKHKFSPSEKSALQKVSVYIMAEEKEIYVPHNIDDQEVEIFAKSLLPLN
jgi:hypothetical protein